MSCRRTAVWTYMYAVGRKCVPVGKYLPTEDVADLPSQQLKRVVYLEWRQSLCCVTRVCCGVVMGVSN
jgi:hypothetical protein